jgi:hypothetical protein
MRVDDGGVRWIPAVRRVSVEVQSFARKFVALEQSFSGVCLNR